MGLFASVGCEVCDKEFTLFYTDRHYIIDRARHVGWSIDEESGEAYCPDHVCGSPEPDELRIKENK